MAGISICTYVYRYVYVGLVGSVAWFLFLASVGQSLRVIVMSAA